MTSRSDGARPTSRITEITRRRLVDALTLTGTSWWGRLEEVPFLQRLYDLHTLPSTDERYTTAEQDIIQHRVANDDWDDNWVFGDARLGLASGPDDVLLRFLAETLHPMVRSDAAEVEALLGQFNEALRHDGYELVISHTISGLPVYRGRSRGAFHGAHPTLRLNDRPMLTEPTVLHEHLTRIRNAVDRDPAAAIASAKELVESLCKIILERSGQNYTGKEDLQGLYRQVADLLRLKAESVPASAKGSETSQKILRTLVTTVQSLAELRNELGLGHGRSLPSPALARHALLAVNSTVAVAEFLLDTWQARVDSGDLLLGPSEPTSS